LVVCQGLSLRFHDSRRQRGVNSFGRHLANGGGRWRTVHVGVAMARHAFRLKVAKPQFGSALRGGRRLRKQGERADKYGKSQYLQSKSPQAGVRFYSFQSRIIEQTRGFRQELNGRAAPLRLTMRRADR